MLLLDVALAHADDWFTFPVRRRPTPRRDPSSGVLVTLDDVTVRDSFGEVWDLAAPPASGPGAWSLFHTAGLPESQLLVWPVAVAPHVGPLLDEILIGVDEDANLAWAVELRADGLQLLRDAETAAAMAETTRTGTRELPLPALDDAAERLASLPARARRRPEPTAVVTGDDAGAGDGRSGGWRQGVLADLTGPYPRPRPGPVSRLIGGPSGAGLGRGHVSSRRGAIPSNGVMLRRRAMLARDTDGRPGALGGAQHRAGRRPADVASAVRCARGEAHRRRRRLMALVDVQVIEGLALPYVPGAEAGLADPGLDPLFNAAWQAFVAAFPGLSLQPLFDGTPVEQLADLVDAVRLGRRSRPIRSSGSRSRVRTRWRMP